MEIHFKMHILYNMLTRKRTLWHFECQFKILSFKIIFESVDFWLIFGISHLHWSVTHLQRIASTFWIGLEWCTSIVFQTRSFDQNRLGFVLKIRFPVKTDGNGDDSLHSTHSRRVLSIVFFLSLFKISRSTFWIHSAMNERVHWTITRWRVPFDDWMQCTNIITNKYE